MLKIIKYGNPLLREISAEIRGIGARERELIAQMGETMYAARGVGLAAPQVGVLERLFVLDVDHDARADDPAATRNLMVFVNPVIVAEAEDDEPYCEGCLSVPGIDSDVFRPVAVRVAALDEHFEPFELEADGLLARVIQHELDHLNGVLFVDRLTLPRRTQLGGKLGKIRQAALDEHAALGPHYPVRA